MYSDGIRKGRNCKSHFRIRDNIQNILPGLRRGRAGSSKKKILRAVGECRRLGIPLRRCLEELGLSSSTYHFWKSHENDESKEDLRLSEAIRCVQEQNLWAYGSKRMAKWLVSEGFAERLNHKRVERVMGKFDLHARIRRRHHPKNYYLTLKENPVELPGNVLARDFSAEGPMRKLVTDITYLPTDEGWVYMAAVMDLWNREIVSCRISRLGPCRGTLIHSDMGWTYTHPSYIKHLKNLGFRQTKQILTVDGMVRLIDDYIHWYNNQRIQKKLGYLSPVDFRKLAT
ncbi:MAG: IS3 family transposase [Sphaerochaetaceae bacterium]|nr:IS3 family transposase [Sphaerochaetaceae bacterium]